MSFVCEFRKCVCVCVSPCLLHAQCVCECVRETFVRASLLAFSYAQLLLLLVSQRQQRVLVDSQLKMKLPQKLASKIVGLWVCVGVCVGVCVCVCEHRHYESKQSVRTSMHNELS